jgi:putative ABC transport system permease protein
MDPGLRQGDGGDKILGSNPMWKNYITVAVRALRTDLQFALLNIGGLGIGLAAALLIFLLVRNETSREAWLPDAEQVYMLQSTAILPGRDPDHFASSPGVALPFFMKDYPQFDYGARMVYGQLAARVGTDLANEPVIHVDPDFFKILQLPVLAGNPDQVIRDPQSLVVSRAFAEKRFGTTAVVGRSVTLIINGKPGQYRIGAVLDDFPANSSFEFTIIMQLRMPNFENQPWLFSGWGSYAPYTFLKARQGASLDGIQAGLHAWATKHDPEPVSKELGSNFHPRLVNIADTYLQDNRAGTVNGLSGDPMMIASLSVIALLILAVAAINYINLATARVSKRAKEVGLRKALGASENQLRAQFLVESLVLALCAAIVSLALVELLLPAFNALLNQRLTLDYAIAVPALLVLATGLGLAGGWYPALVLSRLQPRAVLSARALTGAPGSETVRRGLVIAQFSVSIGLMVCMAVIYAQVLYLRTSNPGYQPKGLIELTSVSETEVRPQLDSLQRAIDALPGVTGSARQMFSASINGNVNNEVFPKPDAPGVTMEWAAIDDRYVDVQNIQLLAGRNLDRRIAMDSETGLKGADLVARGGVNILINRAALSVVGARTPAEAIGKRIFRPTRAGDRFPSTIVGVVENFSYRTRAEGVLPTYYMIDDEATYVLSVRFQGVTPAQIRQSLEQLWRARFPNTPFEATLTTDALARFYEDDARRGHAFALFAGVAIVLCCLGLYGLAAFTAERRTKEIGLRKVLGASTSDIIRLLLWQFTKPVLWANLIAWPVAYWLMRDWLNGFADRIDLSPLWFLAATGIAILIAWATVAGHAWRVARAKPVLALRYE